MEDCPHQVVLTRADRLCSSESLFQKEVNHLRQTFYENGYPYWFFDQQFRKYQRHQELPTEEIPPTAGSDNADGNSDKESRSERIWCKVPYIGRPSLLFGKRIKNLFRDIITNIRVVYTTSKVKDYFNNKDVTPKSFLSKVVYEFTCLHDADIKYVGFTNRKIAQRAQEHLRTGTTAISDHIANCNACANNANLDNFKILKKCRNNNDSKIFEALIIKKNTPVLNKALIKPGFTWTLQVFN